MSRFAVLLLTVCVIAGAAFPSRAALDMAAPVPIKSDVELVVVEAPACIYCHLFHRDVVPAYERSLRAKTVPMRFLDMNGDAFAALALDRPIESVPTVLVLRGRQEIGRIPGYVGPTNFFLTVERLLTETQ